jgi:hypothetical protein
VFINTVLAELWEEKHEVKVDEHALMSRCEQYSALFPMAACISCVASTLRIIGSSSKSCARQHGESWSVDKRILLGATHPSLRFGMNSMASLPSRTGPKTVPIYRFKQPALIPADITPTRYTNSPSQDSTAGFTR